jgi:hypothetical protein
MKRDTRAVGVIGVPGYPCGVSKLITTTSLLAQAEGVGRSGSGGGYGTYSPTRAGDGGGYSSYSNYNKQRALARDMTQNPGKYIKTPAGAPAAPGAPRGPVSYTVLSQVKPAPTWRQQVEGHRSNLAGRPQEVLVEALASEDHARVFAALSFENEGKVSFPQGALARALNRTRSREVARGAALLLSRRKNTQAEDTLIKHIEQQGPGDATALELLMQMNSRRGKGVLMQRAAKADPSDTASLMAIRALAFQPGDDVIVLLRRLSGDWSEVVQKAAHESLELRQKAGLKSRVRYKPPPVGKSPEEVAFIPGSAGDPTGGATVIEVGGPGQPGAAGEAEGTHDGEGEIKAMMETDDVREAKERAAAARARSGLPPAPVNR